MDALILESELNVTLLSHGIGLNSFDCGDFDLNEFLKIDSFEHDENGIAKTFVLSYQNNPVGFLSLCMDAIRLSETERIKEFGAEKHYGDYPALKVARLAVDKRFQKRGVGSNIIKIAVGKAIELSNEVGCRFVTVDAYQEQAGFYKKCLFLENEQGKSKRHVSMRFDLIDFLKSH